MNIMRLFQQVDLLEIKRLFKQIGSKLEDMDSGTTETLDYAMDGIVRLERACRVMLESLDTIQRSLDSIGKDVNDLHPESHLSDPPLLDEWEEAWEESELEAYEKEWMSRTGSYEGEYDIEESASSFEPEEKVG